MEYMPQMYSGYIDAKRKMNIDKLMEMALMKYKERTGESANIIEMNSDDDKDGYEMSDVEIRHVKDIPRNHVRIYREM